MNVLVVDDSLTVRMDLVEAFAESGCAVSAAATAAEARQALATGQAEVIVLDVILPDADGVEFLGELRATDSRSIVLMLSSESDVKDRVRGLRQGADEYVGKPYDRDYVVAVARQLAGQRFPDKLAGQPVILLVHEQEQVCERLAPVLGSAGYRVITADNGEEALRLASLQSPVALLISSSLPGFGGGGGLDGPTVIRRIRLDPALSHLPCLLVSGDAGKDETTFWEVGADALLHHQDEPAVVEARLKAILRGAAPEESRGGLLGPKKILVVHPQPDRLEDLAGALVGEGVDLVMARSAEEALELLSLQPVDCVLLDWGLPGNLQTCARIKSAAVVREIALIALGGGPDLVDSLKAGADDCLPATAEVEVLRSRVRAQLRRTQVQNEKRRRQAELLHREMEFARTRAALIEQLEWKNRELEAFNYSVSHDLRAPLRAISGFSAALEREYAGGLDERACHYLSRIRLSSDRMTRLVDDLLSLSRLSAQPVHRQACNLSEAARQVLDELVQRDPTRELEVVVAPDLLVQADSRLVVVLLENLLGNAWKFTSRKPSARIEVGRQGPEVFFVRDNGAGFDMDHAQRIFAPFQRFHSESEFEGTGIGLATVQRIVKAHGGQIWAESELDRGATFFFRLGEAGL